MNDKKEINFLPFHAINEFMRNDFRMAVIKSTLLNLDSLDREFSAPIDRLTKRYVKVPGFRNSAKAPAIKKAVAMVKPFQKQPQLVAAVLNAWAESNSEFRGQIFGILISRGWKLLPIDVNRTKLPGFLTRWPDGEDFDVLFDSFAEAHPDSELNMDQVGLMVVWLAGRLPVDKVKKEDMDAPEIEEEENETSE